LIEKLLKKKLDDDDKKLIKKHSAEFHNALDSVKICDPAIGSGAFPMGLLHEIFTAKQTLHTFEQGNTKTFDASGVKLNIIQNSIYGVDIEKGAVDIARLRFWLSLIVDEEKPKALPNLDYKIVVGNSLVSKLGDDFIEIDWEVKATSESAKKLQIEIQKNLTKLFDKQKIYFNYEGDKEKLQLEIRNLEIDLLVSQLNLDKYKFSEKNVISGSLFDLTAKEKTAEAERKIKIAGFDKSIRELQKLKDKPEKRKRPTNTILSSFTTRLTFAQTAWVCQNGSRIGSGCSLTSSAGSSAVSHNGSTARRQGSSAPLSRTG
jgi:hypothetical protein